MLRLEKLEMTGFKSFLSRTEFHFNQDITAVVGPNGCGKSNIGDALNWVIGEQSVKSLRGDRMEDVIFNGSEGRKPLGMAEVSLHLSNGAGGEAEKIVVTRRLFRSGESDYLLNGDKARLRDIQETLARINIGSGVYSIIEQGKVDAALSSRPRERRVLIEEAAGIALYKTRKRQAEAKLEATEANLLRVNDIVVEIERQIGSLKRQAARARRYSRTVEEIARHERILLYHEHGRLQGELREASEREEHARAVESERAGTLGGLEASYEEGRQKLDEEDRAWRDGREQLHALEREMDGQERDLSLSRDQMRQAAEEKRSSQETERAVAAKLVDVGARIEARRGDREDLDRRLERENAERERLESARRSLEDRIQSLEAELAGHRTAFLQAVDALSETRNRRRQLDETREKVGRQAGTLDREQAAAVVDLQARTRQRADVEAELAVAGQTAAMLKTRLQSRRDAEGRLGETLARESARREESRHRLHGHAERLRTLEEMESSTRGARELLEGIAAHDGVLADGLKTPSHLETAVEIYLAEYLDAALVGGAEQAVSHVAALKASGRGRVGFLPLPEAGDQAPIIALPEDALADAGFVGRLGDLVEVDPPRRAALAAAMARAVVATDLPAAQRLRRQAPFFDYITLDGDILHTSGLIEGGARRPEGAGLLTRRRLKSDLTQAIETGRAHIEGLDTLITGLEGERAAVSIAVAETSAALSEAEKGLVALQHRLESALEDETRVRSRLDTVGREKRMTLEESAALVLELTRLAVTVTELEAGRNAGEAQITAAQEQIAGLRLGAAETGESLSVVRASLSASRQRLEALDMDLARLLQDDQELRDRIDGEKARQAEMDRRDAEARRRETEAQAMLHELAGRRTGLEQAVRDGELALAARRRELEQRHQEVRAARTSLEESRGAREQITLARERVSADLRHLIEGALPAGSGGDLQNLFDALTPEEKGLELDGVRTALAGLREARDRMGPVNLLALDEFKELEERYTFLTAQRGDLVSAIASLKETIARINRTSRERFLEAFEKIRAGFGETFKTLFGGGRADLRLMTDEGDDDILECGLEIIAQPPGKRLLSVTLMSGGEKALTAIALLFAIFRFRPSPFCLLDEVDAPLDEANVIRFNEMLKSMAGGTQFVMVTHNRRSMEAADMLYGITMEEPGVSRTISVVLGGATDRAEAVRSLPAMLAARHRGNGRAAIPPIAQQTAAPTTPAGGPDTLSV